jgi:CRP-like cAMP-binding protein
MVPLSRWFKPPNEVFVNINKISVFDKIDRKDYDDMSESGFAGVKEFCAGDFIFRAGDPVCETGVVLEGSVNIESVDISGNTTIINNISAGQAFAEAYALCGTPLLGDVVAAVDSKILFLDMCKLLSSRNSSKKWYVTFLFNLLAVSAEKNLALSERIICSASKNARARVTSYLNFVSFKCNCKEFDIPFNRQQMADYLNLDRSALSKELGRMRKDGLISFRKNHFRIEGF